MSSVARHPLRSPQSDRVERPLRDSAKGQATSGHRVAGSQPLTPLRCEPHCEPSRCEPRVDRSALSPPVWVRTGVRTRSVRTFWYAVPDPPFGCVLRTGECVPRIDRWQESRFPMSCRKTSFVPVNVPPVAARWRAGSEYRNLRRFRSLQRTRSLFWRHPELQGVFRWGDRSTHHSDPE